MTNTCDACKHFEADDMYKDVGECGLMGDSNKLTSSYVPSAGHALGAEPDKAYGWDGESWTAGVYVGPKFGCIHWAAREKGGAA